MAEQPLQTDEEEEYRPRPDEKLGDYLHRLRKAASAAQGSPVTQDYVAQLSAKLGSPSSFTKGWLSMVEKGRRYQKLSSDKLKAIAHIYSLLLGVRISANWLLELIGYAPVVELPALSREQDALITEYLRRFDIKMLVMYAGKLAELGLEQRIATLVGIAQSYVESAQQEEKEEIFQDPVSSEHAKMFMKRTGLE